MKDLTVKITLGVSFTPNNFSRSNPLQIFELYFGIKPTEQLPAVLKHVT